MSARKCKGVKFAFICTLGWKVIDRTQTPTPVTVSDLYMQRSLVANTHVSDLLMTFWRCPPTDRPPSRQPPALSFSSVGGCSLAPLVRAPQVKELAFQTGPVTPVRNVAGATKGAEHP